jgi:hypothetical protein
MAYTSYRQRRALGKRYGTDPALELEKERLRQEYAMVPARERLAFAREESAANRRFQEDQLSAQETAGMIGTAGNVLGTAGYLRAITMPEGAPFFGETISGLFGGGTAATSGMTAGGTTLAGAAPTVGLTTGAVEGAVAPAVIDTAAGTAGATAGTAGVAGTAGAMLAPAGAGMVGGMIGEKVGQKAGEWLGIGGEKERSMVGGALGGAAAGAAIGSVIPVVGTAGGAAIGSIVGLVGGSTWICTEIDKHIPLKPDELDALKQLRKYARENHKGWLDAYLNEGQGLVKEMNKKHGAEFYAELKKTLVDSIAEKIADGDKEGAFNIYLDKTVSLMSEYGIEFKEVK